MGKRRVDKILAAALSKMTPLKTPRRDAKDKANSILMRKKRIVRRKLNMEEEAAAPQFIVRKAAREAAIEIESQLGAMSEDSKKDSETAGPSRPLINPDLDNDGGDNDVSTKKKKKGHSRRRRMWCKVCHDFFSGIKMLRQHFRDEHPKVNIKHLNQYNYVSFDLPIARRCTEECCPFIDNYDWSN